MIDGQAGYISTMFLKLYIYLSVGSVDLIIYNYKIQPFKVDYTIVGFWRV